MNARKTDTDRTGFDPEPWRRELDLFVRRMGAGREAEDVVQEAFLRACQSPPSTHPRAWLYRVVLNVLRDRRRAERSAGDLDVGSMAALSNERDPALEALERELAALAWSAVERLPDHQRAALLLRIQRHMDYDEVAIALDCTVSTARQHFHLAVRTVRDRIAGREQRHERGER